MEALLPLLGEAMKGSPFFAIFVSLAFLMHFGLQIFRESRGSQKEDNDRLVKSNASLTSQLEKARKDTDVYYNKALSLQSLRFADYSAHMRTYQELLTLNPSPVSPIPKPPTLMIEDTTEAPEDSL